MISGELRRGMPNGFELVTHRPNSFRVDYRHVGQGCYSLTLVVFSIVWMSGSIWFYLETRESLLFLFIGFGILIVTATVNYILGRSSFHFETTYLDVHSGVLEWQRNRQFLRSEIQKVEVVRSQRIEDGHDYGFFDVNLYFPKRKNILTFANWDEAAWLAQVISEWVEIEAILPEDLRPPIRKDPVLLPSVLLHPLPEGVEVIEQPDGAFSIVHRRRGMWAMNFFLAVWVVLWGTVLVWLFPSIHSTEDSRDRIFDLVFLSSGWLFEILGFYFLLKSLFERRVLRFSASDLRMEVRLFAYHRSDTTERRSIKRVIQIVDGGVGDDSFPSWGLELLSWDDEKSSVIDRQPYELSCWLGKVIAEWAGTEFLPARR